MCLSRTGSPLRLRRVRGFVLFSSFGCRLRSLLLSLICPDPIFDLSGQGVDLLDP